MKNKKYINLINIILVILSLLTIFLFSSEKGANSKNTSQKVAREVISIVVKKDDKNKVETFVNRNIKLIRKVAHLTEFFILGFFLTNIIKDYKIINYKTILICVLVAFLYACTDEIHQIFVSGRTARIFDVIVDTLGSFLGSSTYYLLFRKSINKNSKLSKIY